MAELTELKGGGNSSIEFDYNELDSTTADFLRKKETNMREIVGKAYTDLGRELKEARDRLAGSNQYDGVFEKWLASIGMNKMQACRLIQRYSLVTNCDDQTQSLLEDMPVSLTYEIAKPSADATPAKAQAKAEVLSGEITKLKQYKERIKELEQQSEAERRERERLERELDEVEPEVRYETRTEYVEVKDEEAEQRLREYEEKFGDLRNYDEHITASHRQDMIVAVMSFSKGVREFAKRYSYMTKYKGVIDNLDEDSKRQYDEAITALKELGESFEYTDKRSDIIVESEFVEII